MRRELNEIEYFNWCFGQPYNLVGVVRIRGEVRPDRLRTALDKARRRHPLLGVNTEVAASGLPWFSSEGVGEIPLTVAAADPEEARRHGERELHATFAMDASGAARLPLIRVALFLPRQPDGPCDVVLTLQHVIADGMSLVFLVRDLLAFLEDPDAPVEVLDAAARPDDVIPPRVRRRIPTSPWRFRVVLWLARIWATLRFGREPARVAERAQRYRSWDLGQDRTRRLLDRCHAEGVSVQSALCAAFLPGFDAIHTPVNLRAGLARPVGQALGLFVGGAQVSTRPRPSWGFWANARRVHRHLRRAMRDPWWVFRMFSKAVPRALVQEFGPLMMRIQGMRRPLAITNLGVLDRDGNPLQGRTLVVESFYGAVSSVVDASVVTAYTVGGDLRLHVLTDDAGPSGTVARDEAERAVQRLYDALDEART